MALVRWTYALKDLHSSDRIYIAGLNFLWSVLEINTGLICSCTVTFKPLLKFAKLQGRSFRSSHTGRKSSGSEVPATVAVPPRLETNKINLEDMYGIRQEGRGRCRGDDGDIENTAFWEMPAVSGGAAQHIEDSVPSDTDERSKRKTSVESIV